MGSGMRVVVVVDVVMMKMMVVVVMMAVGVMMVLGVSAIESCVDWVSQVRHLICRRC